jgi:hypothetical protein
MCLYIAAHLDYTYIYMDIYIAACINQDSANPAMELNGSLGQIIGLCDMMVTPVHDNNWQEWSMLRDHVNKPIKIKEIKDAYEDYGAEPFAEYLARGWCRLEMFFNANMQLKAGREKLFGGKLKQVMEQEKRRPHLLFGTREKALNEMPIILRALRDEEFVKYHPGEGDVVKQDDKTVINTYVEELFKINAKLRVRILESD